MAPNLAPKQNRSSSVTENVNSQNDSPAKQDLSQSQQKEPSGSDVKNVEQTGSENTVKNALSVKIKQQMQAQSKQKINNENESCNVPKGNKAKENNEQKNKQKVKSQTNKGCKDTEVKAVEKSAPQTIGFESKKDENVENEQDDLNIEMTDARTPGSDMEIDQSEKSHVKRLNFEDVSVNTREDETKFQPSAEFSTANLIRSEHLTLSGDVFSKSTGHMSFKQLLEATSENSAQLNKSMGFIEKSKNSLFVTQSNIPGRSAFVPFSQVQSRKDSNVLNQSVAMAIPLMVQPVIQSQAGAVSSNQIQGIVSNQMQGLVANQKPGMATCMIAVPTAL